MFKLLLSSAILAPCCIVPFIGMGSSEIDSYETQSFEQVYVEPQLEKLENCESADLGVFFHDAYIEAHSADFVSDALQISSACSRATYRIQPIILGSVDAQKQLASQAQTDELLKVLQAHGVDADVSDVRLLKDPDALFINGQSAVLKIIINEQGNA